MVGPQLPRVLPAALALAGGPRSGIGWGRISYAHVLGAISMEAVVVDHGEERPVRIGRTALANAPAAAVESVAASPTLKAGHRT